MRSNDKKNSCITGDNGKEFVNHESIAKQLESDFCFVNSYYFRERRVNENTNGLVRQYFPINRTEKKPMFIQVKQGSKKNGISFYNRIF